MEPTVKDVMTTRVVSVTPHDTLERAARLMYARKVKRLPVVDADGHLVGIIGRSDLLSVFDRSDEDIREVMVEDGIVTLGGAAETTEFGHGVLGRYPIG
jgi:CBS-domain-containing membrane protein